MLLGLRDDPKRPFVAVLGGAKVSDKLGVIDALLGVVDSLVIGGGMCFTFLAAQGFPVGDSLFEPDQVDTCRRLLEAGKPIHLPDDIVGLAAGRVRADVRPPPARRRKGLDIGPGTGGAFTDVVIEARTVFWNGPMGVFEDERFAAGTRARGPGRGRHPRLHRRGRWRLRRRPRRVRPGRRRRPRVHGRGSVARAARAGRPARPRSPPEGTECLTRVARKPLISGNWKMHHNHFEAIQTVQKLAYLIGGTTYERVDVSVHPPFTDLRSVQTLDRVRPHPDRPRRPALPLGGQGRLHRRGGARRSWPSST